MAKEAPKCIESGIHRGGDGKVAIMEYGKVASGYSVNLTRRYAIPDTWTDEDVRTFEDEQLAILKVRIDEQLDVEFQERWDQRVWEGERRR